MNSIRALTLGVLVGLCTLVLPGAASAATCTDTWTGGSGEWTTASNWSTKAVPAAGSHVCIEKAVTVTMTYYSPPALASLDVGGETNSGTAELQVGISDVMKVSAVTVGSHGLVDLDGTYNGANAGNATLGGGTITNQGKIEMKGAGYSATMYGTVVNEGTIAVPFGGVLLGAGESGGPGSLDNKGTITVAPASADPTNAATIRAAGFPITDDTGGSIDNEGSFYVTGAYSSGTVEGSYTQGEGSESGNPIEIGQNSTLAYTGSGSSTIAVANSLDMTGSLSAGQHLQVGIGTVVTEPSSFTNAGSITLNGNYYGGGGGPAEIALASGTFTNAGTLTAESNDSDPTLSGNFENQGTVLIKADTTLEQVAGSFVNASGGTLTPQISSSAFGAVQIDSETSFVAGGTLAPVLLGGFVPAVGQEFRVVGIRGGSWSGQFGALANDFGADYSNSSYIAAIYGGGIIEPSSNVPSTPSVPFTPLPGQVSVAPATARVVSLSGTAGSITIKLSCPAGPTNCARDSILATVTEHIKHGKLTGVSAAHPTKLVAIVSGSALLKAGSTKELKLALNRSGQALLKHYRSLATIVTVTSAGKKIRTTSISIREPVKHHKS